MGQPVRKVREATVWFTVAEAADYLRVARDTVYRWAKRGDLTLYKLAGTATRVRREELDTLATPKKFGAQGKTTRVPRGQRDAWAVLSGPALAEDWDSLEDSIYDRWEELYGVRKG